MTEARPTQPEVGEPTEQASEQLTLFGGAGGRSSRVGRLWSSADDARPIVPNRAARVVLVAAIGAYIALFSYWTIRNHDGYGTGAFDLGLYDQGLWLLSRFKAPFVTIMGRNLFGDHTSFILLPLVPVYWVFPSPKVLLVAQAGALGVGALPAFLIAREKLRSEVLAVVIAGAYLVQPAIGWTNFEQFHPDVFEVPLVLFAFWLMLKGRWTGFILCSLALLAVKEDAAFLVLALGIYAAVKHNRRVGVATCIMAGVYVMAAWWWILPALNGVGTLNTWRIPFGGPWGVVRTAVTDPGTFLSYLTSDERPWYVWQLTAPLALLPFFTPSVAALAAVPLGLNLLSNFYYQYRIKYHYTTLIVPVLVIAAIFTVAKAKSTFVRQRLALAVLGCALVCAYLWGPTTFSKKPAPILDPDYPTLANVERAIDRLPSDAVVSSFYQYVPHLAHRERVYMFPTPFKAAYWGVFDQEGKRLPEADDIEYLLLPTLLGPDEQAVLDSIESDFVPIYEAPNVTLYERKPG